MKYNIGKGKNFSIAKSALIFYFEDEDYKNHPLDWGELDALHKIVDIAGAKHQSFLTPTQVIACLRNSPYWKCECVYGFYSGIGNGRASICEPSEKGIEYYNKYLKDRD